MDMAIVEAREAFQEQEVPIGAVVVCRDKVIGKGHNKTEALHDITAHAEMIALTAAENYLGSKVLSDCTLYVTIEPCVMCAGALRHTRISRVVWGAPEPKYGFTQFGEKILHPTTVIKTGVLEEECIGLMRSFFKVRR